MRQSLARSDARQAPSRLALVGAAVNTSVVHAVPQAGEGSFQAVFAILGGSRLASVAVGAAGSIAWIDVAAA
jgi:hypothetical protein